MAESREPEEKLCGQRGHGIALFTNENSRDGVAFKGKRERSGNRGILRGLISKVK